VGFQGQESFPHTVVGIGFKVDAPPLTEFTEEYGKWQKADRRQLRQIVLRLTPPILIPLMSRFYIAFAGLTRRST
jgi:hypothetical protein